MRRSVVFALTLALAAAAPAAAKEGAQAHLLKPLPTHANPGTVITVKWTVDTPRANGKRIPFAATGMFVKLVGASGASTTATARQQHGPPYSAQIRIPTGGIRSIQIGLHGWAFTPTGKHAAPELFPITNNPLQPTP
jgi:hypothetical protein